MAFDLNSLLAHLTNFYYSHTVAAIALAVILVLLICFRPKAMLKTAGIVLAFAVAAYFFTLFVDMAGTGQSQKTKMIHTTE
jgi:amino acid permease